VSTLTSGDPAPQVATTRSPAAGRMVWLFALGAFALGLNLFFLFGYSTFYGLWCKITGTQMNPNNPSTSNAAPLPGNVGRDIEVFFEGKAYDNLPVRFYPSEPRVIARIGADARMTYRFKNLSEHTVRFRPVHMVSPLIAGQHFSMKMCFCFTDQTIPPGASTEYPVVFSFDDQIDPRVTSVTVRYSLHRIAEGEEQSAQQKRIQDQLEAAGGLPGGGKVLSPDFTDVVLPDAPVRPVVPVPLAPASPYPTPKAGTP
jgi:cytochrome c oxidase assembly protein subunit 11